MYSHSIGYITIKVFLQSYNQLNMLLLYMASLGVKTPYESA